MKLHHVLPLALAARAVLIRNAQRLRETFVRPIPIAATATLAAGLLLACDITQQHLDETADRLAEATVASGNFPTSAQINAATPLQAGILAGSNWRMVLRGDWPHARAVASLGTNGRIVWHVATDQESPYKHWRVQNGALELTDSVDNWHTRWPGLVINDDNVCLSIGGEDRCYIVFQRVTLSN